MLLRANALAKGNSGRARRDGRAAARLPQPRRPARSCPRAARSARPATSRRSRTSPCRSSAKGGVVRRRAARRWRGARAGRAEAGAAAREGGPVADQRHAVHGGAGRARARARAAARARRRLCVRALARGAAGLAQLVHPAGACAASAARPGGVGAQRACGCSTARRSSSRTAGATRCRTRTRSGARRRCTARRATCSTTSSTPSATELNAATDNPLVLVEDEMLVSAGNFHGQPLAFALDALAMAVAELASISERRVERLVNPNLSDGLPAFLTTDGGLNSGFMIPQYVAASLVSENKSLCHPASVDSIPTSAGQEDHVSMGNAAGLKAWQVARELRARARDRAARRRAGGRVPRAARAGRRRARDARPRADALAAAARRPLARPDIEAVAAAIRDGSLLAAVEAREVGSSNEPEAWSGAGSRSCRRRSTRTATRCSSTAGCRS